MLRTRSSRTVVIRSALALSVCLISSAALAQKGYVQTNLASDIPGLAKITDPNLKNPWGISMLATSPFWVANQVTGTSTLYADNATTGVFSKNALVVNIVGGNPTGTVSNAVGADFAGDRFIFSGLGGAITGWQPANGTTAVVRASTVGAAYTGLTSGLSAGSQFLYAADARGGKIDVFDRTYAATTLSGGFIDPNLPAGFSPFNIQNVAGQLFVTYTNAGAGIVDVFDTTGNLVRRFTDDAVLDDPWGVALAPSNFGEFSNALLIGNKGNGLIHAFDATSGSLLGALTDNQGNPLAYEGLWGLTFGNGANGGLKNALYFAAGIEGEQHGLFGRLQAAPEPGTYAMLAASALTGVMLLRRRRK